MVVGPLPQHPKPPMLGRLMTGNVNRASSRMGGKNVRSSRTGSGVNGSPLSWFVLLSSMRDDDEGVDDSRGPRTSSGGACGRVFGTPTRFGGAGDSLFAFGTLPGKVGGADMAVKLGACV